ncbi:MAG: hydroxymethylglutaryl-CoA reductase, degradative [Candidatus Aenigmarchaeota archaeon]|nr:hydroxymethylglutaryl-CoA reductase, degradative [Candidatus Aenigmarchaeota archaeon]
MASSEMPGFHRLEPGKRLEKVKEFAGLTEEEAGLVESTGALDISAASQMIENVIGTFELPFGIATNFLVNGRDYLIPMVLEEPSVVAGASFAAKLARAGGGFEAGSDEPVMIGQVQLLGVRDAAKARQEIMWHKDEIVDICNKKDSMLVKLGGGLKDVEVRELAGMLVVHLHVDVRDAMGANAVNTMSEAVSPYLERLTGGHARLRIISNLAVKRLARARAVWKKQALEESVEGMKGGEIADAILDAYAFAYADEYRCATHNKGVMNGIDAVCIATGNDFRALEAGAHTYAGVKGVKPLTKYYKDGNGDLVGEIELPMAVGIIGGSMKTNPLARVALKILGVKSSSELAQVMATVGLAQNFAAIRALATEGIQKGHMRLHARNIALGAGAREEQVDGVVGRMVESGNISFSSAKEILESYEL